MAGLLLLLTLPFIFTLAGEPYFITLCSRILLYALAAVSLDFILGFGGMVSLAHAAFIGIGGYTVAILSFHASENLAIGWLGVWVGGSHSALISWFAAIATGSMSALAIGALSLRTSGIYFIMLTLAFGQMIFLFFTSLDPYGGSDGINIWQRSQIPGLDLADSTTFYYVCLAVLLLFIAFAHRMLRSHFGMVLQAARQNETRAQALGYPVYRYKLAAFTISGAMAGLAGALAVNQSEFIDPGIIHWSNSAEILVMVILGGIGTLFGPVFGAFALLLMEEAFSAYTEHWQLLLGPLLIVIVLSARKGIYGLLVGRDNA
jgi:branched-chain amino acid transport system permease protein